MDNIQKISEGSKLFVNAQYVYKLLSLLSNYYDGKCTLEKIFKFIHIVQKQKKVKLYKELKIELDEFMYLKQFLIKTLAKPKRSNTQWTDWWRILFKEEHSSFDKRLFYIIR